jgi:hypothetical protein
MCEKSLAYGAQARNSADPLAHILAPIIERFVEGSTKKELRTQPRSWRSYLGRDQADSRNYGVGAGTEVNSLDDEE